MIVMVVLLSDHGRPELGGGDDCYGCVLSDHGRPELGGGGDGEHSRAVSHHCGEKRESVDHR